MGPERKEKGLADARSQIEKLVNTKAVNNRTEEATA